eukprot:Pgem_evm1s1406
MYAKQLSLAIQCMHENNIVHRDVKLENVCLNDKGDCILIDFGEAIQIGKSSKGLVGTLVYMSPQLIKQGVEEKGKSCKHYVVDTSVKSNDVWSLGCLFYSLIVGRFPWGKAHNNDYRFKEYCTNPTDYDNNIMRFLPLKWRYLISNMLEIDAMKRWNISMVLEYIKNT